MDHQTDHLQARAQAESPAERQTEALEIDLLLAGVARHCGYDFRGYRRASVTTRVRQAMLEERLPTVSALQERVLRDDAAMRRLVEKMAFHPAATFANPDMYLALRREIIPVLRTYPFVRIWFAGCSTGEEVYSTAIVLHEEGLYDRCQLYATDVSEDAVARARAAVFPRSAAGDDASAYLRAGGRAQLSAYYASAGASAAMVQPWLRRQIVFSQYDFVSDAPFNEFQLVLCRNVLARFERQLKERALEVVDRSLCTFGTLGIGRKDALGGWRFGASYREIAPRSGFYRKLR